MSDEIKINRITQTNFKPETPGGAAQAETKDLRAASSNPKTPWLILLGVAAVLVVGGVLFKDKLFPKAQQPQGPSSAAKVSEYQAVFLANGQVYFGKLSGLRGNYVTLKDIYYLQVGPQQGSGQQAQPNQPQSQQEVRLVKLGDELHGPLDEMHINNTQILFYEDLKEGGQVVTAILKDKQDRAAKK